MNNHNLRGSPDPRDADGPDAGTIRHIVRLFDGDTGPEVWGPEYLAYRPRGDRRAGGDVAGMEGRAARCRCSECRAGDALPVRLQGWPGCYQFKLFTPRAEPAFDHVWFWRAKLGDRKGQRCAVIARGKKGSVCVKFEDGSTVITSRHAVRKM